MTGDWLGIGRRREARDHADAARRQAHEDAWMAFWRAMHAALPKPAHPDPEEHAMPEHESATEGGA